MMNWRRKWLHTPVFFPGEFHGQKNPVGYSPWGHKESSMTNIHMMNKNHEWRVCVCVCTCVYLYEFCGYIQEGVRQNCS